MQTSKKRHGGWPTMRRGVAAFAVAAALALPCTAAWATPEDGSADADTTAPTISVQDKKQSAQKANLRKSEMIYGMLKADGSVRETYVVNRFESDEPCGAQDYGAYTDVANLSTTQVLACENKRVDFDKGETPFFYQGTLGVVPLPWDVTISYTLDGRTVEPEQLAGASGRLGISVKTRANTQVNKAFFESFVLQATFTLDGDLCSDVKAKDATIAAAGKDHTVAFTALPGHDGDFELSAQVKDFEMPAAQIAALPYSTVVEMPDTDELESGLNDLADAVSQLSDGTSKLADGVEELSSGAGDLADGADAFGDGLSQLASSSDQIVDASAQVKKSLGQIAGALGSVDLSGLDDLKKYAPMLREAAETLDALRTVMQELDDGYARMAQTLDTIAGIIDANPLSDEEIAALRAEVADNPEAAAALERLLAMYDAMHAAIDDYHAAGGTPETIEAQLEVLFADGGELDQAVQALRTAAGYLDGGSLEQMGQLAGGLSQLSSGYSQFHSGLVDYTDGVQELNKNYRKLSSGVSDLADGTSQLSGGANELSDGVAELARATSDLPAQMRERMDEMMADYDFPEFKPVSFVDERNRNVTAVQFVLMTDAIEVPEPAPVEPAPEPEPTILDRFFDLFGL